MVSISLAAALNVLALSERIRFGSPLLAENRFRHQTKVVVVMSRTNSRWIARTTQQVNKQIHTLLLFDSLLLRYIGPVKSTAVYANGGATLTRNEGSGGAKGALKGLPSTGGALENDRLNKTFPPNNPILCSNFSEGLLHSIVLHPSMGAASYECVLLR